MNRKLDSPPQKNIPSNELEFLVEYIPHDIKGAADRFSKSLLFRHFIIAKNHYNSLAGLVEDVDYNIFKRLPSSYVFVFWCQLVYISELNGTAD